MRQLDPVCALRRLTPAPPHSASGSGGPQRPRHPLGCPFPFLGPLFGNSFCEISNLVNIQHEGYVAL